MPDYIDHLAEFAAIAVLHHIDTMYPQMWSAVSKTAKKSIRNTVHKETRQAIKAMLVLMNEQADPNPEGEK